MDAVPVPEAMQQEVASPWRAPLACLLHACSDLPLPADMQALLGRPCSSIPSTSPFSPSAPACPTPASLWCMAASLVDQLYALCAQPAPTSGKAGLLAPAPGPAPTSGEAGIPAPAPSRAPAVSHRFWQAAVSLHCQAQAQVGLPDNHSSSPAAPHSFWVEMVSRAGSYSPRASYCLAAAALEQGHVDEAQAVLGTCTSMPAPHPPSPTHQVMQDLLQPHCSAVGRGGSSGQTSGAAAGRQQQRQPVLPATAGAPIATAGTDAELLALGGGMYHLFNVACLALLQGTPQAAYAALHAALVRAVASTGRDAGGWQHLAWQHYLKPLPTHEGLLLHGLLDYLRWCSTRSQDRAYALAPALGGGLQQEGEGEGAALPQPTPMWQLPLSADLEEWLQLAALLAPSLTDAQVTASATDSATDSAK